MRTARSKVRTAISSRPSHDALLMRGATDFDDLAAYRRFIDEIVSRKNARNAKRIEAERPRCSRCPGSGPAIMRRRSSPSLRPAASRCARCSTRCRRGSSGIGCGSGCIDDRLDLFIGAHAADDPARAGRPSTAGKHAHVVDYRHVIHALRRKPMALLNLVYRDQLFPREAYRQTFDRLLEQLPESRPAA